MTFIVDSPVEADAARLDGTSAVTKGACLLMPSDAAALGQQATRSQRICNGGLIVRVAVD